jgi:uncharacterized zinc-type alcohol dehydrogenase-like protein
VLPSKGYAAQSSTSPLAPFAFDRRDPGPTDVQIDILFCGVCHSDVHTARGEWAGTRYPCVPGHEIVGRVVEVGGRVARFKTGDNVGVGCMVDSCQACSACAEGLEQYCENGFTGTYNGPEQGTGGNTYGGYSNRIVVDEKFVLNVRHPQEQMAAVAPLLCAGITTWSPLRKWKVGPGQTVGVVGLGGLGHMGVKLARALGAQVVLFTTSPGKSADALRLGAQEVVISTDGKAMAGQRNRFDLVLDTVAAPHDLDPFLGMLKRDGTLVLVGAPSSPHPSPGVFNLILKRRRLAGSLIGGIAETQEMLDFCARHGIVSDIETIPIASINEAYERMLKSDVKYRFVIDMATL